LSSTRSFNQNQLFTPQAIQIYPKIE